MSDRATYEKISQAASKYSNPWNALAAIDHYAKPMRAVMMNCPNVWVVTPANAARLRPKTFVM